MKYKSFLIIGGHGFIGKNFYEYLNKKKINATITSRYLNSSISSNFRILNLDLNNYDKISEMLNNKKFDIVIYLGGSTASSTSYSCYDQELNNNIIPLTNILNAFKTSTIKKLVYFSSGGAVYGSSYKLRQSENDNLRPKSPYGLIKKRSEEIIRKILYNQENRYLIIRPSNPYGKYQDPLGVQGIIPKFMLLSSRGKKLPLYGNGEIVRDFIYIEDLIDLTYKIIQIDLYGIFNIGSGEGLSISGLISKIINLYNQGSSIEYFPPINTDVKHSILNIRKLESYINLSSLVSIDEGLLKTKKYIEKNFNYNLKSTKRKS